MSGTKKPISNLDKLKGSNLKNFRNEKEQVKKNKNLLIKTSEDYIDKFKIIGFDYYKNSGQLSQFAYRHYIVIVLLNIEKHFKEIYGGVSEPNEDYVNFYKKRGTRSNNEVELGDIGNINFLLPTRYADLYFNLMHTYYINECSNLSSYSISQFFIYIVEFIETNKLVHYEVNL